MNNLKTKLFIFTLPQEIVINENEKKLVCNIVVIPKYDPLISLAENIVVNGAPKDFVPFAESDIKFNTFLVKGNELLPTLINHNGDYVIAETALRAINPDRKEIFTQLSSFFKIEDKFGRGKVTTIPIKKYLPQAYRNAYGFAGARQGAVTDDSYFCALKENTFAPHVPPADKDHVNWSQVMAFCLHQPELARQLGMLYRSVEMQLPSADYFKEGGWVYADIKEDTSYADLPGENIQRYAAWIPPVTKSRELFSPVLFPVEEAAAAETFDDIFDEVLRYNDGFAKIVHASQAVSTDHLGEEANGTAPVTDMGIRLAWDDEQVLEWYNRGFQSQGKIGTPDFKSDTPLVVSRYRLDVADITQLPDFFGDTDLLEKNAAWKSQVSVTADELKAGNIDLGSFKDELGVEVLPAKHGDKGDYWLPAYFTNWNGASLCLPDPLPEKLNQLDEIKKELQIQKGRNVDDLPKVLYQQPAEDKVALKYGNEYAFRVRLSDISGGGPGPGTVSVNRGEHKIATQKFKRFVAPQPPAITAAAAEQSIIIERPRLNYPAIMFTNVNTDDAAAELLLDRANLIQLRSDHANTPNRKWLREVSLPDPDVTQVEIVVEIKSLDMDRENSYHAINKILPKEPFIFLYKTFRNFPAYQLNHDRPDDVINLAFSYQDISLINFLAPDNELGLIGEIHSDNGPLLLPTAREIRLTIRSFCPGKKADYFGSEASRISIPVIQSLRKDPVKLEEAILFKDPKDPLISIFFQPQSIITPQFREQQKTSGKGNETNSDLLDRLCSITGLVHKNGSVSGNDNIRTQFGCSAVINHSISPDHSSITFSSRDDFYHKWINVIQLDLNRDWTWDLLKPDSFKVSRQWRLDGDELFKPKEELGGIFLTKGLNWQAMSEPDRSFTRLIFIDALDPKPAAGKFPEPLEVKYFIEPQFKQIKKDGVLADLEFDADIIVKNLSNLLPITTVPAQVPKIVSVGIALSPDSADDVLVANRYAETAARNRYLWIEFDTALADAKDMYFARVLAYSPDQMLAAPDEELSGVSLIGGKLIKNGIPNWETVQWKDHLVKEQTEPPINLDPETVRVVRPGQPFDLSGLEAMQAMTPANTAAGKKPRHFLLPLPPGIYPDSEELFGFFTYEFRVGHYDTHKWSTAQGRFGSPLRLTGVQHPAPPMLLSAIRDRDKTLVTTRHAQSFFQGKNVTPAKSRTDIYACLYAQVLQADGIHYRNILIDKTRLLKPFFTTDINEIEGYNKRKKDSEDISKPFTPPESPVLLPGTPPQAVGFWNMKLIREKLRFLGINENASLSVLTIELMPRNNFHNNEIPGPNFFVLPLQEQELSLDQIRILRTSRLSPVMEACAVEV